MKYPLIINSQGQLRKRSRPVKIIVDGKVIGEFHPIRWTKVKFNNPPVYVPMCDTPSSYPLTETLRNDSGDIVSVEQTLDAHFTQGLLT